MKKILSLILAVLVGASACTAYAAPIFSDNVAAFMTELKIMQGDPDGNMRLDDLVSRAECAKIAVNTSKWRDSVTQSSKTSPFYDVLSSHWASPYVTVAVRNGLVNGYLDASFKPQQNVSFEEATAIFLRVLGYSDSDYGASWPEGPVSLAKNIGILDGLNRTYGEALSRRDIMTIAYNTLNTPQKDANTDFISTFNRTITDDVILISSDTTKGAGKITTSLGVFNVSDGFDYTNIGKQGSALIRNNDTIVSFIANNNASSKDFVVNSVSSGGVVAYDNGVFSKLNLDSSAVFYDDGAKTSFAAMTSKISMGDTLTVNYKQNGEVDFVVYKKGNTIGPVTVFGTNYLSNFGADQNSVSVMRDGEKASLSDILANDIVYFSKSLNMIFAYSKKITGVFESAYPNKEAPISVTVSGVSYDLEGAEAVSKLSSSGTFNLGDTVTLLLGKDGDVADVLSQENLSDEVFGFLAETGTKETNVSGTIVNKPYVKIALPSGNFSEFTTTKNYDSLLNQVVRVSFQDGNAKVSKCQESSSVSGKFVWENSKKTFGSSALSDSVKIIEVSTTQTNQASKTASVFPQRLNGFTVSSSSVLYYDKNSDGKISELILKDVTGDLYDYGIVTKAQSTTSGMNVSGAYTFLLGGYERTLNTSGKSFSVNRGEAVKITQIGNVVTALSPLTKITQGTLYSISGANVKYGSATYTLSDRASIYVKDGSNYSLITKDELLDSLENYMVTLYADKNVNQGGRIRIIVATKK